MPNLTGMQNKYTVIKNEDVESLPQAEIWREKLQDICNVVNVHRHPKPPNMYIVINTDEPYIEEVIEVLKRHGHWG